MISKENVWYLHVENYSARVLVKSGFQSGRMQLLGFSFAMAPQFLTYCFELEWVSNPAVPSLRVQLQHTCMEASRDPQDLNSLAEVCFIGPVLVLQVLVLRVAAFLQLKQQSAALETPRSWVHLPGRARTDQMCALNAVRVAFDESICQMYKRSALLCSSKAVVSGCQFLLNGLLVHCFTVIFWRFMGC